MAHRIHRRIILSIAAALASVAVGLPMAHAADPVKPRITVVTGSDPAFSYLTVAVNKGFFEKEGIDATLKVFDDGNVALDSLLTGNAQIGSTSEVGTLTRRAKGGPISVVASGAQSPDFYGIVGSDKIKEPKDLIGKTVGMPKGSGGHLYFGYLFSKLGLDISKINIKFLQSPEAIAALSRGDIDAMAIWEPTLTRVTSMVPGTHVISRAGKDQAYFMNMYLLFAQDLLKDQELSKKSMRAIIAASEWIPANWDEAVKIVAKANHMDNDKAEYIMKLNTWKVTFDEKYFMANFNSAGQFAQTQGLMQKMPEFTGFLRPDVLAGVAPERVKN
ncbi:hypothetical protein BH09PSE5_BH09PSE5_25860 [soil metagenome]